MEKFLTAENITAISKGGYERPLMFFETIILFCH